MHQLKDWLQLRWDDEQLWPLLTTVRHKQGRLRGYMEMLGFDVQNETLLETLTTEVLKSSEIEGQLLNPELVRSSVASHLGLEVAGLPLPDRDVDAVVRIMLDATQNYKKPLTKARLCGWQAALFPSGYSGIQKITVGKWRSGPMQVVSGAIGKGKVHFEAPEPDRLNAEMKAFLIWFNHSELADQVVKSGVAHFWFVTIHPFADGNGRVARALADLLLTRSDGSPLRFYSMSAQLRNERRKYYEMLEKTQKGNLDLTEWLIWYVQCLDRALDVSENRFKAALLKKAFWDKHADIELNERQRKVLNKLFDGFEGKLTTSKWAKLNKCSGDTALRDVTDLVNKGMLVKENAGGRSTNYTLQRTTP